LDSYEHDNELPGSIKLGNFFTIFATINLSRSTLLLVVGSIIRFNDCTPLTNSPASQLCYSQKGFKWLTETLVPLKTKWLNRYTVGQVTAAVALLCLTISSFDISATSHVSCNSTCTQTLCFPLYSFLSLCFLSSHL
jgi:hypothetical protein